jgi:hypothetical protein
MTMNIFWVLVCGAGVFVGWVTGYWHSSSDWKALLIKRGQAQYNAVTGEWEWK